MKKEFSIKLLIKEKKKLLKHYLITTSQYNLDELQVLQILKVILVLIIIIIQKKFRLLLKLHKMMNH